MGLATDRILQPNFFDYFEPESLTLSRILRLIQITQWKTQLLDRMSVVFEGSGKSDPSPVDIKTLHAKIGQLTLENDFLETALTKAGLLSAKR